MDETIAKSTAEALARVANSFRHPLRIRIVRSLAINGAGSATTLSRYFGDASVGDCHYHLKALRKDGIVELVRSRQVRGAKERIYRLVASPVFGQTQSSSAFDALLGLNKDRFGAAEVTIVSIAPRGNAKHAEIGSTEQRSEHQVEQLAVEWGKNPAEGGQAKLVAMVGIALCVPVSDPDDL